MICVCCGKEFEKTPRQHKETNYCSRSCYNKIYYIKNKERLAKYYKKHFNDTYIYHPIKPKYKTEEEKQEAARLRRKEYYLKNKERYKELNREWYAKNGNNPDVKRRHAIAMKKYYEKKKKERAL